MSQFFRSLKTTLFFTLIIPVISLQLSEVLGEDATSAPFSLNDEKGSEIRIYPSKEKILVLEWYNPGCPFVKKFYSSGHMQKLQKEFTAKGVTWLTISSTNPRHPDFISPDKRVQAKEDANIASSHFLFDDKGELGQRFAAKTTPHIFILSSGKVVYSGAVDNAPDSDSDPKVAENYIQQTVEQILTGSEISKLTTRPYGCSVKY